MISVIMVQYNKVELTKQAIRSFKHFHQEGYEIILIDNGSTNPAYEEFKQEFPDVQVILNKKNVGFGAANNIGAQIAKGDILFFLNNDTITVAPFISVVEREFLDNPNLGVLGSKLLNEDHSFQLSAGSLPTFFREIGDKIIYGLIKRKVGVIQRFVERKYSRRQVVGWVTGAALFIRKDLFLRLGGFNEAMFMYFDEKDLCIRTQEAGKVVVYDPSLSLIHLKGGSSMQQSMFLQRVYKDSQMVYYRKHRPAIERLLLKLYFTLSGKV